MKSITQQECQELFIHFRHLRYGEKLKLFDEHFELIPFDFPAFDPGVTWYSDAEQFNNLSQLFAREKRGNISFLEKTIISEEKEFVFNIVPQRSRHRVLLNEYLVKKFLAQRSEIQKKFLQKVRHSNAHSRLIKERIWQMAAVLDWIPDALLSNSDLLHLQFLNVFNHGVRAYDLKWNNPINNKRKFIELYLFSQGMLFMQHYNWLIALYEKTVKAENTELLSLSQKVLLLHELGVIDYLKQRLKEEDVDKKIREISRIISLVTAENEIYYSSVLEFVNALTSSDSNEPINARNCAVVKDQLSKLKL